MKKIILGGLFLIVVTGVLLLFVLSYTANAVGNISNSIAEIEEARAFGEAAAANHDAIRILGVGSTLQDILLIGLVLAVIGLLVYVVYLKQTIHNLSAPAAAEGRWVSGPNAGWKRLGEAKAPVQPALTSQDMLSLMMMGMMNNMLHSMQQPQPTLPPSLPAPTTPTPTLPEEEENVWQAFIR